MNSTGLAIDRDHQDDDREHDVGGQQEVEQERRHGRDERHDDGKDRQWNEEFAEVGSKEDGRQAFGLLFGRGNGRRDCSQCFFGH